MNFGDEFHRVHLAAKAAVRHDDACVAECVHAEDHLDDRLALLPVFGGGQPLSFPQNSVPYLRLIDMDGRRFGKFGLAVLRHVRVEKTIDSA